MERNILKMRNEINEKWKAQSEPRTIRAAHAVSGNPGGNVKTACSVRGSDWGWFVDEFKRLHPLFSPYFSDKQALA